VIFKHDSLANATFMCPFAYLRLSRVLIHGARPYLLVGEDEGSDKEEEDDDDDDDDDDDEEVVL
jgi:hypothetical protein